MAVTSRGRTELQIPKKWKERETSPERTKVWTEPKLKTQKRVPVVYYLCRDGQLDHPHFMEVPLSSSDGLYLRDVINRLNFLRGNGIGSMYSWSSKRSYKNGFVWHDLAEDDFIYPAHGQEYVLKGSEFVGGLLVSKSNDTLSSSFKKPPEQRKMKEDCDFPFVNRRRNQSWSSIDLHEYKVYKTDSPSESGRNAADASTQTDDKRRRRNLIKEDENQTEDQSYQNQTTELNTEEISPPPSDSSPETLESLMKADGRLIVRPSEDCSNLTANNHPSGRLKASTVLMQLISCGSVSFKDCGPVYGKDQWFPLISQYKSRFPRVTANQVTKEVESFNLIQNGSGNFGGINSSRLEDKEYFSGSLIETKKVEVPALKRSSSYNADQISQLDLADKDMDGMKGRCIPRKPKPPVAKKESSHYISSTNSSQHGSKRLDVRQP